MESLRCGLTDRGISERAAQVLLDARRSGTQSAYSSSWNKWASWCSGRQTDPVCAPVELIANFLTELFDSGKEYSTLNGYRSAISAYHAGIQGTKVGQHALIISLMKGFFHKRPSKPKYEVTWDVHTVLDLLKSWGTNSGLSLKKLSLKVTMLMALCSAARASELGALVISHLLDKGNEMVFSIPGLTKTRRAGQAASTFVFSELPEDPLLDVVECIRAYVYRTVALRRHHNQLLISFQKPHGPLATCSVARWLKEVLSLAGIDTDTFKAHSTRGAATSKQFVDKANWRHASTFRKFYYRDCADAFQKAVLTT